MILPTLIKTGLGLALALVILGLTLYSPWLILKVRAQAVCPSNTLADGLVSAYGSITGLGNPQQVCVTGAPAYIGKIDTDSYAALYNQYYQRSQATKVPLPANTILNTNGVAIAGNILFKVNGNLTVNNNAFVNDANSRVGIYFVEGNLFIPANITYGATNPRAGLVFIVRGQINIDSSGLPANATQQQIDAVLISEGTTTGPNPHSICTACSADGSINTRYVRGGNTFDPNLIVRGGFVSLNPNNTIRFIRVPQNTSVAAETIQADPRFLVILKDLISNTIRIEREI